jgi:hypothetical protein
MTAVVKDKYMYGKQTLHTANRIDYTSRGMVLRIALPLRFGALQADAARRLLLSRNQGSKITNF